MKEQLRQVMSAIIPVKDDEWAAFEPHIRFKTLRKREYLHRSGQYCHEIAFVLKGALRQYYLLPEGERTTFFYFEGDFACDYKSFLTQQASDLTIEALEDCELLYFQRDVLMRLYQLYPTYATFGRLIAEEVYMCAIDRLNTFLLNSPEERYRHFLKTEESTRILERIPQHYVASYLGITPVSLSRIRARVARMSRPAVEKV